MPGKPDPETPIYEIRITLRYTKPSIWRRVAVPSDVTLSELHEIVQIAMGWMDGHLHQFRLKTKAQRPNVAEIQRMFQAGRVEELGLRMRNERVFTDPGMGDIEGEDECSVTLCELCGKVKDRLLYEYDFGDGWEHTIDVTKTYAPKDGARYPVCLAGKRACPPEDCGGVGGFYNMLAAVNDPKHPEHETYGEWLSPDYAPEFFDCDEVNAIFEKWERHQRTRKPAAKGRKKSRAGR